jgi:hypothetical protein
MQRMMCFVWDCPTPISGLWRSVFQKEFDVLEKRVAPIFAVGEQSKPKPTEVSCQVTFSETWSCLRTTLRYRPPSIVCTPRPQRLSCRCWVRHWAYIPSWQPPWDSTVRNVSLALWLTTGLNSIAVTGTAQHFYTGDISRANLDAGRGMKSTRRGGCIRSLHKLRSRDSI